MSCESLMDELMEAKNRLKAYTVENGYERPEYETVSKRVVDFRNIYKVRVTIEGLVDTTGEGFSRRLAEYRAAVNALNEIREVREEQKKSKEEQLLDKQKNINNQQNNDNEVVPNGDTLETNGDNQSDRQLNGHHNSNDNVNSNDENQSNSIIISADVNASAGEGEPQIDEKLVNGHNSDDRSQRSSRSSDNNNDINGGNSSEDIDNESEQNSIKINGNGVEMPSPSVRKFAPLQKTPVQKLHEWCVKKKCPYPFYDTTCRDRTFLIKCRVEFNENDEKREFFGTGSGSALKEAKQLAAEEVVQQLSALDLM